MKCRNKNTGEVFQIPRIAVNTITKTNPAKQTGVRVIRRGFAGMNMNPLPVSSLQSIPRSATTSQPAAMPISFAQSSNTFNLAQSPLSVSSSAIQSDIGGFVGKNECNSSDSTLQTPLITNIQSYQNKYPNLMAESAIVSQQPIFSPSPHLPVQMIQHFQPAKPSVPAASKPLEMQGRHILPAAIMSSTGRIIAAMPTKSYRKTLNLVDNVQRAVRTSEGQQFLTQTANASQSQLSTSQFMPLTRTSQFSNVRVSQVPQGLGISLPSNPDQVSISTNQPDNSPKKYSRISEGWNVTDAISISPDDFSKMHGSENLKGLNCIIQEASETSSVLVDDPSVSPSTSMKEEDKFQEEVKHFFNQSDGEQQQQSHVVRNDLASSTDNLPVLVSYQGSRKILDVNLQPRQQPQLLLNQQKQLFSQPQLLNNKELSTNLPKCHTISSNKNKFLVSYPKHQLPNQHLMNPSQVTSQSKQFTSPSQLSKQPFQLVNRILNLTNQPKQVSVQPIRPNLLQPSTTESIQYSITDTQALQAKNLHDVFKPPQLIENLQLGQLGNQQQKTCCLLKQPISQSKQVVSQPQNTLSHPKLLEIHSRQVVINPQQIVNQVQKPTGQFLMLRQSSKLIDQQQPQLVSQKQQLVSQPNLFLSQPQQHASKIRQFLSQPQQLRSPAQQLVNQAQQLVDQPQQLLSRPPLFINPQQLKNKMHPVNIQLNQWRNQQKSMAISQLQSSGTSQRKAPSSTVASSVLTANNLATLKPTLLPIGM